LKTNGKKIMSVTSKPFVTDAIGQLGGNAVRLLHIDTSIKTTGSLSREMSAAAVERLKREAPDIAVHYRDLAAHPLGDLTERVFAAHAKGADIGDLDPAELSDLAESGKVLAEFLIVLLARGGIYGEGSPNGRNEHAETYLRSVFSVIGIDNLEVIVAEGVDISPELRAAALESAMGSIETLAA
jgi:FMN-dependent NADH-azoreductase